LLPAALRKAQSAKRRYLSNAEADFEVIRPAWGDTLHRMEVKLSIGCKKLQLEMEICNQK